MTASASWRTAPKIKHATPILGDRIAQMFHSASKAGAEFALSLSERGWTFARLIGARQDSDSDECAKIDC